MPLVAVIPDIATKAGSCVLRSCARGTRLTTGVRPGAPSFPFTSPPFRHHCSSWISPSFNSLNFLFSSIRYDCSELAAASDSAALCLVVLADHLAGWPTYWCLLRPLEAYLFPLPDCLLYRFWFLLDGRQSWLTGSIQSLSLALFPALAWFGSIFLRVDCHPLD